VPVNELNTRLWVQRHQIWTEYDLQDIFTPAKQVYTRIPMKKPHKIEGCRSWSICW
jgi:hypothetical protein